MALGPSLGSVFVEIGGDASPFDKAFRDSMAGAHRAATRGLAGISRDLDRFGSSVIRKLGTAFKIGGAAIAAGLTAVVGMGVQRLVGIDDARGKLRGLGHDAAGVDAIMTNALASVKGTAFGMAEAATTAATAVAAGIKPGGELEKYLKLTADAATIAGIGMDEMGSIMNKVTTSGRAMTDNLNQLADRGIPIFTWLQEEYGVTAEALNDMVSQGKVDATTFRQVIANNIGGAALESGNTVRGSFANMGAAIGRFGATLAGPVFDQATGFFAGVIDWVDNLTEKFAGPAGETINRWFENFGRFASDTFNALSAGFNHGMDSGEGWIGIMERVGKWGSEALDNITDAINGFKAGWENGQTAGEGFVGWFERLGNAARVAAEWVAKNEEPIKRVMEAAGPAALTVGGLAFGFRTLRWFIRPFLGPVGILFSVATGLFWLYQNAGWAKDAMDHFAESFMEGLAQWGRGFERFIGFVERTSLTLYIAMENVKTWTFQMTFGVVNWFAMMNLRVVWHMTNMRDEVLNRLLDMKDGVLSTAAEIAVNGIASAYRLKQGFIRNVGGMVLSVVGAATKLKYQFLEKITELRVGAAIKFAELVIWVRGLPRRIVAAFGDAGEILKDVGRSIMEGLREGVEDKLVGVVTFFGRIARAIPSWIKGPLGISSPSKVFAGIGRSIMDGLGVGLSAGYQNVERLMGGMAPAIEGTVGVTTSRVPVVGALGREPALSRGGVPAGATSVTPGQADPAGVRGLDRGTVINIYEADEPRRTGAEVLRRMRERAYLGAPLEVARPR